MAVWNLFFSSVLLPLIAIALLWRRPRQPFGPWIATLIMAAGLVGFGVLAAPWGWFGLPLRYVIAILFLAALIASWRRAPAEEQRDESPLRIAVKVLIGIFFGGVAIGVLRAHAVPPGAVELQFPLRNGAYLIAHGGSTPAANMHAPHPAQRYALDIVQVNAAGMRARGLYPKELASYAIWDAEVVSPCEGVVTSMRDGLPDNRPGMTDEKNAAGNHVVIRCGDFDVTLAHLRRGTVRVGPQTRVTTQTVIGRAGNSGNTTEPHLHVHAERKGEGIPARFDGKWLVRNALVRK